MLTPDRQKVVDESLGEVTLMPWLRASAEERARALHPHRALDVVERFRRRGRRGLVEVYALLAIDRAAAKALSDERLAERVAEAVRARELIALPGWVAPRAEPVAPPVRVELPPLAVPPARVRKEATDSDLEPTIRLVNLESRHFVPGKESVRISYAIDGPVAKADKVRLIVKSLPGGEQGDGVVARLPVEGPYGAAGEMFWDGHLSKGEVIQLDKSPYELRFELTSKSGHRSKSEGTEVQLEVHSVSIRVDDLNLLEVPERNKAAIAELRKGLDAAGMPGDCAARVLLDGPVFPVKYGELVGHASATSYQSAVGDGVMVPLVATIKLKSKTGRGRRAPASLRGTSLCWDVGYETRANFLQSLTDRGANEHQRGFLARVADHAATTAAPHGVGIHHALGGRRGGGRGAVFWKPAPPWEHHHEIEHPWQIDIRCNDSPTAAADSAVYFASGAFAGDVHRLRATIPAYSSPSTFDPKRSAPPLVHSNVISLTNWRVVPIAGEWFVGETKPLDLESVQSVFARAAVQIDPAPVRSNATFKWRIGHARVTEAAVKEQWPFLADALESVSGDDAIHFRPFADYRESSRGASFLAGQLRRVENYFIAANEQAYRLKCEEHFQAVFERIANTFKLPNHGLTVLKFNAEHPHNQNPSKTSRKAGFFLIVEKSARDRAIVCQFTKASNWNTTAHEIGHALFLAHQPGHVPGVPEPEGSQPEAHDAKFNCIMSYAQGLEFCGLCLLKLAGSNYWQVQTNGSVKD